MGVGTRLRAHRGLKVWVQGSDMGVAVVQAGPEEVGAAGDGREEEWGSATWQGELWVCKWGGVAAGHTP